MSELLQILIPLGLLLVGWLAWITRWVVQHHKACHSEPTARIAALEQRVSTCEEHCKSNRRNWHELRRQMSPVYLWLQYVLEKLNINVTVLPAPVEPEDGESEDMP